MTVQSQTPTELVEGVYANLENRLSSGRKTLNRPLSLAEKILINHLENPSNTEMNRGESYVDLRPDRVAMQDATAQMAWLQFMTAGLEEVQVPTTTHCDHLIQARIDSATDLQVAVENNSEVSSDVARPESKPQEKEEISAGLLFSSVHENNEKLEDQEWSPPTVSEWRMKLQQAPDHSTIYSSSHESQNSEGLAENQSETKLRKNRTHLQKLLQKRLPVVLVPKPQSLRKQ